MVRIEPLGPELWPRLATFLQERWGFERVASRGRLHYMADLPAFVALDGDRIAGAATYHLDGDECEVVTLDAQPEGEGTGALLLSAVIERARAAGCRRAWLITTNDNMRAQRFYERAGGRLVAVHWDAVTRARETLKPEIPLLGVDGVPIRDEHEYEWVLHPEEQAGR